MDRVSSTTLELIISEFSMRVGYPVV